MEMGKKMKAALEKVEPRVYGLREAVEAVKQAAYAKFDESVDLALRLGVDPKRSDQMVRGTTSLPHGTGKKIRVLVFAKGEKEQEARAAGHLIPSGNENRFENHRLRGHLREPDDRHLR